MQPADGWHITLRQLDRADMAQDVKPRCCPVLSLAPRHLLGELGRRLVFDPSLSRCPGCASSAWRLHPQSQTRHLGIETGKVARRGFFFGEAVYQFNPVRAPKTCKAARAITTPSSRCSRITSGGAMSVTPGNPRAVMPAAARMGTQLAIAPAALRVAATASRAARAIRPLSLAIVTKRKPMPIIRAA